jgi:leucyl aminopeptidase
LLRLALALLVTADPAQLSAQERPIRFATRVPSGAALVLPLGTAADLTTIADLDAAAKAEITRSLAAAKFDYAQGSKTMLTGVGPWARVLVIGTGGANLTAKDLQDIGGTAIQSLRDSDGDIVVLATPARSSSPAPAADMAVGARLGGYEFSKYKYKDPAAPPAPSRSAPIHFVSRNAADASTYALQGQALVDAVAFSRDLIREPANVIYPETFVSRTREAFAGIANVSIKVLDVPQMEQLGMGAILSVGRGSVRPPRMLIVEYRGNAQAPLVALAGKGITFDSGGISLKPGAGMSLMKGDMAGAAGVVGAVLSLAKSRAPVNASPSLHWPRTCPAVPPLGLATWSRP